MADEKSRRRWISLGEVIALAALVISAFGLWITWSGSQKNEPTRIVEQKQAIALVLRASSEREGRALVIQPVESGHALQALTLTLPGASPIEVGSDGRLDASTVQAAIDDRDRKGAKKVRVRVAARYVEAGADRTSTGSYTLSYHWEGGGLFGGKSVRLTALSR